MKGHLDGQALAGSNNCSLADPRRYALRFSYCAPSGRDRHLLPRSPVNDAAGGVQIVIEAAFVEKEAAPSARRARRVYAVCQPRHQSTNLPRAPSAEDA
jgi:hypothetical protein